MRLTKTDFVAQPSPSGDKNVSVRRAMAMKEPPPLPTAPPPNKREPDPPGTEPSHPVSCTLLLYIVVIQSVLKTTPHLTKKMTVKIVFIKNISKTVSCISYGNQFILTVPVKNITNNDIFDRNRLNVYLNLDSRNP